MYGRRLPGRTPRPLPVPTIDASQIVPSVTLTGRLVGVEGGEIMQVVALELPHWADQCEEQRALTTLVNSRVNITVELVDVSAALCPAVGE